MYEGYLDGSNYMRNLIGSSNYIKGVMDGGWLLVIDLYWNFSLFMR